VSDVSYEDASDLSATSRACRARGIWRTTRQTDKLAALHCSRPPADNNHVSAWQAEREVARHALHARHPRSILAPMSRVSGVSTRMSRRCYEETASVEFKLYGAFNVRFTSPRLCSFHLTSSHLELSEAR